MVAGHTVDDGLRTLHGQRVVIVGGTSGVVRGAVQAAVGAGGSVGVAGGRREAERGGIAPEQGRITHAQVDVTDERSVRSLFEQVGTVDHLFVTATPPSRGSGRFLEQDVAAAQSFMTGKFFGSWACARYAAPSIRPGVSITVNTIRPGLIDSDMWSFLDDVAREDLRRKTRETLPARRMGTIDDIGHAAIFLMTNPYVTGAVLEVSGGEPLVTLDL